MRIVDESSYGSALMYFTGSKDHNVALRGRTKQREGKLNEYGLFDSEGERLAGETEKEVLLQPSNILISHSRCGNFFHLSRFRRYFNCCVF